MTAATADGRHTACERCLRRSWLLAKLSPRLDYCALERGRLDEVLALGDEALIDALGGRRRDALMAHFNDIAEAHLRCEAGHQSVCHHDGGYPRLLSGPGAPRMLHVAGGCTRLRELTAGPVVAITGTARASDYGLETAKSLARGLSVSGVRVAGVLGDGIGGAAHAGALEAQRGALAVFGGGLEVGSPASKRSLYARVLERGCAVSELPCRTSGRRWGAIAAERIIAGLAEVTVVVESEAEPAAMTAVVAASSLGRVVGAVPGRVTSPLSHGTHGLLAAGAPLIRGAADVLDLLASPPPAPLPGSSDQPEPSRELAPRLQAILDAVAVGRDVPDRLAGDGRDPGEVLLALTELELMGLLIRGDGGRYLPR